MEANAAREPEPTPMDPTTRELYVRKAVEFVYMNFSRNITVEDIAAYIGIGRKYLHSLFVELVGTPPSEFLIQYRLHKACELMADRALTISDIARSVGYPNAMGEDQFLFGVPLDIVQIYPFVMLFVDGQHFVFAFHHGIH
jgi:AraC-like DNA-binding protein